MSFRGPWWLDREGQDGSGAIATSAHGDRRIYRQALAAPKAIRDALLLHVQDTHNSSISTRTISHRLVAGDLYS
ncbi:hypothetical protein TNCV_3783781 [Trichonephila clavipes]|nr:hypothetical protein TNCV_3783781 [Trichonephila clavipes]